MPKMSIKNTYAAGVYFGQKNYIPGQFIGYFAYENSTMLWSDMQMWNFAKFICKQNGGDLEGVIYP